MPGSKRWRFAFRLSIIAILGSTAGCGGTPPPPPPVSTPLVMDSQGPPSAAAADVKNPSMPSAIEPPLMKPTIIDYGPPSAAAADAARYKP
jgi:hypothetical protein